MMKQSKAPYDARPAAIGVQNERNTVSDEDANPMESHLSRQIREHLFSAVYSNSKESIGEALGHCAERLFSVFRAYHLSESEPE